MQQNSSSQLGVPVAIVIAGALIAGALYATSSKPAAPAAQGPAAQQGPAIVDQTVKGIQADDHIVGSKDAKVVVVEFSDPECPFCRMFHETMHQVMDEYKDSGKVAWVYRNLPLPQLHQKARKEAMALECAGKLGGNDGFWKFTDELYKNTPSNDGLDHALLPTFAEKAGVDKAAFNKCLDSEETKDLVDEDVKEGESLGINGTPQSFVIANGKQIAIEGAQRFPTVKETIEKMLAE
jgi:protein-disulfide isomerase